MTSPAATGPRRPPEPDFHACSTTSRRLAEPLAGTAPVAELWVAVEQPGPWGRQALAQSRLDRRVADTLAARVSDAALGTGRAITAVAVRRPGDHPVSGDPLPRTVLLAHTGPGQAWLRSAVLDLPEQLLDIDLAAAAEGRPPDGFRLVPGRTLLVCTNGRRDLCCALRGRAVALSLAARHPGSVWETSHLGGHRFSPVVMSLPDGYVFGGPGAADLTTAACRGRTSLPPEGQAAELAVLRQARLPHPAPLDVTGAGSRWTVRVGADAYRVEVERRAVAPDRPESCGKASLPAQAPVVVAVTATP